jgi:hypothetical protein
MLSLSKHSGQAFSARTLRQAQGDNALFFIPAILFCLFLSINVLAQKKDTVHTNIRSNHTEFKRGKPMVVIDGVVSSYDSLKNLNPANIFKIDTLKSVANKETYISTGDYGAIIVETKMSAIKRYQKKFSAFSKKYKDYIENHHNNDDSCTYLLSGGIIYNNIHNRVKKLYDIPNKNIKKVDIIENQWYNGGESKKYLVTVTTKK